MPYNFSNPEQLIEQTLDKLLDSGRLKEKEKGRFEKILRDVFIEQKTPKESIGFTDRDMESMYSYGYNLFTHGKFFESRLMMEHLMSLDPDSARYPFACGAAYQQLKDYQMAASYYLLAFHLDQEDPIPLYHMFECFKNLNDLNSAYMMLENIVQRAKDKPEHSILVERARRTRDSLYQEIVDKRNQKNTAA